MSADWHLMFVWQDPERDVIGGFCGMLCGGKNGVAELDMFCVAER